jgi:hypothetical protein
MISDVQKSSKAPFESYAEYQGLELWHSFISIFPEVIQEYIPASPHVSWSITGENLWDEYKLKHVNDFPKQCDSCSTKYLRHVKECTKEDCTGTLLVVM